MPTRPVNQPTKVPIVSPVKGVVRSVSAEQQPPETCPNALNVLPYDLLGRKRVAQRFGISEFTSTTQTSQIQGLLPIGYVVQPGAVIGDLSPIAGSDFSPAIATPIAAGTYTYAWPPGITKVFTVSVSFTTGTLNSTDMPGPGDQSSGEVQFLIPVNTRDFGTDTIILAVSGGVQDLGQSGGIYTNTYTLIAWEDPIVNGILLSSTISTVLNPITMTDTFQLALTSQGIAGMSLQLYVNGANIGTFSTPDVSWTPIKLWGHVHCSILHLLGRHFSNRLQQ